MIVFPDDLPDAEKWYRLQHMHMWYNVLSCCRSCATRKLHLWINGYATPKALTDQSWLVKLNGDPCEVVIPGIGQCELVIQGHPRDDQGRERHQHGPIQWNGGAVFVEVDEG